jgi:hypothetical protein
MEEEAISSMSSPSLRRATFISLVEHACEVDLVTLVKIRHFTDNEMRLREVEVTCPTSHS